MRATTHPRPLVPAPRRSFPLRQRPRSRALQLEGADLSHTDLRGLDLTGANLRNANLTGVRTGLGLGWRVLLTGASLLASVAIGVLTGRVGHLVASLFASDDPMHRSVGIFATSQLLVLLAAAAWRGTRFALERVLVPLSVLELVAIGMSLVAGGSGLGAVAALGLGLCLTLLLALAMAARTIAGTSGPLMFTFVAISGALASRALGGGGVALALALSAMYLSRRALTDSDTAPWFNRIAVLSACAGGTSLREADLRGAKLQRARLSCTDFRGAKLSAADFERASLELCAFDESQRPELPTDAAQAGSYFAADRTEA